MRALLLLALLPALALAQGRPNQGGSGSGGGTACALASSTSAFATYYRATTTTLGQVGFQCDGVNPQCVDLGPGTRNMLGTNASGDILLGPGSGSGTVVRNFGNYIGLDITGQNLTASNVLSYTAALNQGNTGFMQNTNSGKPVLVTDPEGFQINGTTAIKGWVQAAVAVDFASINNNSCLTQSVTVTGATAGDAAWGNADFALPLGVSVGNVRVTAANTVELTLCNVTSGGALDPASGNFIFRLSR